MLNDQKIPQGWILNKEGKETEDPNDLVNGGTLLPFGKHKGYGLAISIEILSGVLTGASMMGQIPLWIKDMETPLNIGQGYVAIDILSFMDLDMLKERIDWVMAQLKSSPLSEGSKGIFFPGEIEHSLEIERIKNGIPISEEVWNDLEQLSIKYQVEI